MVTLGSVLNFDILRRTFSALQHRNYRLFFFGQLVSLVGTWLQNTALSWLVYSTTRDERTLGMIAFVGSIPVLLLFAISGTVADQYPKRTVLVWTQTASAVLALALAALVWLDLTSVWAIAAISLLLGVATAFDLPTRQAFVVEMVGKEDVMNAIALNSAVFNGARLVGPMLGAALIAFFSIAFCFLLNGVSFIAVIVSLLLMRFPRDSWKKRDLGPSRVKAMMEGARYIYHIPQFRALMILVVAMTIFGWSYTVNLPVVAVEVLKSGSTVYGGLLTSNGAGALIAALTQAAFAGKFEPRRMAFAGIGAFIFAIMGLGFATERWMVLALLVICGWGIITFFITANSTFQRRVPDELRGRIMGLYSLAFAGLFPFGSLLAGFLAHRFGVQNAFLISGSVLLVIAGWTYLFVRKLPTLKDVARLEEIERVLTGEEAVTQAEQIARG